MPLTVPARGPGLAVPLALLFAAALTASAVDGTPRRLPGVALMSTPLLHLERATACFAIVVAVVSVLAQATRGRLPTALSTTGFTYAAASAETEATLAELLGATERVDRAVQTIIRRFDESEGLG